MRGGWGRGGVGFVEKGIYYDAHGFDRRYPVGAADDERCNNPGPIDCMNGPTSFSFSLTVTNPLPPRARALTHTHTHTHLPSSMFL